MMVILSTLLSVPNFFSIIESRFSQEKIGDENKLKMDQMNSYIKISKRIIRKELNS